MTFNGIAKIVLHVIILILAGRLTIDIGLDTPVSAQTLAVLTLAYFTSVKETILVYTLYLGLGALGFPAFADGKSGVEILMGNSGGYLLGFAIAAISTSYLKKEDDGAAKVFGFMLFGTFIILLCGYIRLSLLINSKVAWTNGILPFLSGALIKVLLGVLLVFAIRYLIKRIQESKSEERP